MLIIVILQFEAKMSQIRKAAYSNHLLIYFTIIDLMITMVLNDLENHQTQFYPLHLHTNLQNFFFNYQEFFFQKYFLQYFSCIINLLNN